jgi:hypothetical protein
MSFDNFISENKKYDFNSGPKPFKFLSILYIYINIYLFLKFFIY